VRAMATSENVEDATAKRECVNLNSRLLSAVHFRRIETERCDFCTSLSGGGGEGLVNISDVYFLREAKVGHLDSAILEAPTLE